jgi:lipopolysaccharide export system protein LptA
MEKALKILANKNRMNVHSVFYYLMIILAISGISVQSSAQTSRPRKIVKLLRADVQEFDKSLVDAQRVKGNVIFEYEGTMFYCDSAYIYASKDFDAFGNIRIVKGSEYNLTGKFLHIDQKKKIGTITDNVVLRDNQMTLTGSRLNYYIDSEIASYTGGARIVSNVNQNVLTSKEGSYHTKTETFYFKNKVVLTNPDYVVKSDTLQYNDLSEIAYFFGPTTIEGDDTEIYCENGWYNTKKDICQFNKHAWVRSEKTILKGDSIYYNGEKQYGEVFRNISIRDTTTNIIISGNYGIHHEQNKESLVTDRALLTQIFSAGDSLFMHADTLKSLPDSAGKDVLYAFHGVKFYKSDFQGKCDSLSYAITDSTLRMFYSPILWNGTNQITGDSISINNKDGKIDRMIIRGNSFICSESKKEIYNQIKGRNMTATFQENDLHSIYVEGNGQLVYFPEEDAKKDSTGAIISKPKLIGLNKGECSNIYIEILDNEIKKLRLEKESNSTFSPMNLADKSNFLLDGFLWKGAERPKSKEDLFLDYHQ